MSADNGIYILVTQHPEDKEKHEYRVKEFQAFENIQWDDKRPVPGYTEDANVIIQNAREMYQNCPVFTELSQALLEADRLMEQSIEDCGFAPEYGISKFTVNRVF